MPKDHFPIVQFDKGFQDALDKRDIPDGALAECINASITQLGTIRLMSPANNSVLLPDSSILDALYTPGRGLFSFGADYDIQRSATVTTITDYGANPYNGSGADPDYVYLTTSAPH